MHRCRVARLAAVVQGVAEAVATIRKERRGRDVYVLGAANVGKSAFVRCAGTACLVRCAQLLGGTGCQPPGMPICGQCPRKAVVKSHTQMSMQSSQWAAIYAHRHLRSSLGRTQSLVSGRQEADEGDAHRHLAAV